MKRPFRFGLFALVLPLLFFGVWLCVVQPAYAQVDTAGLRAVGAETQLSAEDPRQIAVRIIHIALGTIGTIMVVLMVYAGFLWMTAGGNQDQVDKAKKYIRNAIIGLMIILTSWAIALFVIRALISATGSGTGRGLGSGPGGGEFGGDGAFSSFQIESIQPAGDFLIRNVEVRFLFTQDVNNSLVAGSVRVVRAADNAPVEGVLTTDRSFVTFVPTARCPAPDEDRFCFEGNTEFRAFVGSDFRSASGQRIVCGGFAPSCEVRFKTGNLVDTSPPTVFITEPIDGQSIPQNSTVRIATRALDNAGVSYVQTYADDRLVGRGSSSASSTPRDFEAFVSFDTRGVATGTHTFYSVAHDIDSNASTSTDVRAVIRPERCFDEHRVLICGDLECGLCAGSACTWGGDCASGVCSMRRCIVKPIITGVSPGDGRDNTFVTVRGLNFGTSTGSVWFHDTRLARSPAICGTARVWSDTQVVVEAPAGAVTGPISIQNIESTLRDTTNDDSGPRLPDYRVTTTTYPGLCLPDPDHGLVTSQTTVRGNSLGSTTGRLRFADRLITSFRSWAIDRVEFSIPVLSPGSYDVQAMVDGQPSNMVGYTIDRPSGGTQPFIESIDPLSGPIGEYITVQGRFFGDAVGRVLIAREGMGTGDADTDFPEACETNNAFWRNNRIVVKVPNRIGGLATGTPGAGNAVIPGNYRLFVRRADTVESNQVVLSVTSGMAGPGVCSIVPNVGPANVSTTLYGERLGTASGRVSFAAPGNTRVDASLIETWGDGQIQTRVPTRAVTGFVRAHTATTSSNAIPFTVRNCADDETVCASTEICCRDSGICASRAATSISGCPVTRRNAHYAWRTSTGDLPLNPMVIEECVDPSARRVPSPSPWSRRPRGDAVCVNAAVAIRFTTPLRASSVNASNVSVKKCLNTEETHCSGATISGRFDTVPASDREGKILFTPLSPWEASSTYEIVLTTRIESPSGLGMLEKREECGTGNAYCFSFRTRPDEEPCLVGAVTVLPHPHVFDDLDQRTETLAVPLASEDACLVLDGSHYAWTWSTSEPNIEVTNEMRPETGSMRQTATSRVETGERAVQVRASVTNAGRTVAGAADMYVRNVPPRVESKGPDCQTACVNAAVWVNFNVEMDQASLFTGGRSNLLIKKCANENCRTFSETIEPTTVWRISWTIPSWVSSTKRTLLTLEPVRGFEPGASYKVLLKSRATGGLRSRTRLPLTELNDPEGYAWTFRTMTGERALCPVDHVDVTPLEKIETEVGARQVFDARPTGAPDSCNPRGQPLVAREGFSWAITDRDVAKFVNGSAFGMLSRFLLPPEGCTLQCTNRGADGVVDRVASCGNRVVETVDTRYCASGRTAYGEACRVMPVGARGSEECEPVSDTDALCDPQTCLWRGVNGGTCGNGRLDRGEQCDPLVCWLGARAGQSCAVDADCGMGSSCTSTHGNLYGCASNCLLLGASQFSAVDARNRGLCGNGSVGDAEACDDGNLNNDDGCSRDCLFEGSAPIHAVCGNRTPEPGESCERRTDGTWPDGCNRETCLWNGRDACLIGVSGASPSNCCGNSRREDGEDCDDGNTVHGDGCSSRCLYEGSSISARPFPSFCGDSVRGVGEEARCEPSLATGGGPSVISGTQVAEITGDREPRPEENNLMTTPVQATYRDKTGEARYGLQCGFVRETECRRTDLGLTVGGCCAPRPVPSAMVPAENATSVCRNVEIRFAFNVPVDLESLSRNFYVVRLVSGTTVTTCPTGTQPLDGVRVVSGWRGWIARLWRSARQFFFGDAAHADIWCYGGVGGVLNAVTTTAGGMQVTYALEQALAASTTYRLVFKGEPDIRMLASTSTRRGVKSERGVAMNGDRFWEFTTRGTLCAANQISVIDRGRIVSGSIDENEPSPYLFTKHPEEHRFEAKVEHVEGGISIPISPVREYHWTWYPWQTSARNILTAVPALVRTISGSTLTPTAATVAEQNKNGVAFITAGFTIDRDEVNIPTTSGTSMEKSKSARVLFCNNPWPSMALAPFEDKRASDDFGASGLPGAQLFASGPYYNFGTLYCLDAGVASSTEDDLPRMEIRGVAPTPGDLEAGILRQYFLSYREPARLRGDGIGIRIMDNPRHLALRSWYESKGFRSDAESLTIDGYEALKSGDTIYVSALSTESVFDGPVRSYVYVFSRNPDAQLETVEIFRQLIDNLSFNVNLSEETSNQCYIGRARPYVGPLPDRRQMACTADWECAGIQGDGIDASQIHCASFKEKIQRDLIRFADFTRMTGAVESAKAQGKYPMLTSGTFIRGLTNSLWKSWDQAFGPLINDQALEDPVNRFLTCGRCKDAAGTLTKPCMTLSECETGQTCAAQRVVSATDPKNGFDPETCWNADRGQYLCPSLGGSLTSHFYQYRALNNGEAYELAMELEGPAANRYDPPMTVGGLRRCLNTRAFCSTTRDCEVRDTLGRLTSTSTCNPIGGAWIYEGMCQDRAYGASRVCGDGIKSDTETCEIGETHLTACDAANPAGGTGTVPGTKLQICNACQGWADGPATRCLPNVQCGNGRRDGTEVCDDGLLNGTYGHCNRTCSGVDAYCGDNQLSPGELCDSGVSNGRNGNGDYCRTECDQSCSVNCRSRAPMCGDSILDRSNEQCDGSVESTTSGLCLSSNPEGQRPCRTNADCDTGIACASIADLQTPLDITNLLGIIAVGDCRKADAVQIGKCAGGPRSGEVCFGREDVALLGVLFRAFYGTPDVTCPSGRCIAYPTKHSRSCKGRGEEGQCSWNAWSACLPDASCGDGRVDAGEACDDGNTNNNDACTAQCVRNVCGDGYLDRSREECDFGSLRNGQPCPGAEYGSSCVVCTALCQQTASSGGYCGDGVRNGAEQCDGRDIATSITCEGLGYDYADYVQCNHAPIVENATGRLIRVLGSPTARQITECRDGAGIDYGSGLARASLGERDIGLNQPIRKAHALCVCLDTPRDVLSCQPACTFGGCARCRTDGAVGIISALVMDAVYYTRPVTNARVTLYARGQRVRETFTDDSGRFTFSGLDDNPACQAYRVVVEKNNNNEATATVDESINGGYWPFESVLSGTDADFRMRGIRNRDGKIFLTPRVAADETLVVMVWDGSLPPNGTAYFYLDAHLIQPDNNKIFFGHPGDANLMVSPYAKLYCFDAAGAAISCQSFSVGPQTVKYRRAPSDASGQYSFTVDNFSNRGPTTAAYLQSVQAVVRVVTRDRYYEVLPPDAATPSGKYWHVFNQDRITGAITILGSGNGVFLSADPIHAP